VGPSPEEFENQVLRQVAVMCALHFSREEALLERDIRQRSDILLALLGGEEPTPERSHVLLNALYLSNGNSYRIGIFPAALDSSAITAARQFLADARYPHAILGGDLVVLAPASAFTDDGMAGLSIADGAKPASKALQLFASRPTTQLDQLRVLYKETVGAIALLRASSAPPRVVLMEDWPIHRLALSASSDSYLRERSLQICGVLYEPRHSDLLQTVTTYFENHLSKIATARALHLHINTVKQRLQRLEEILGLSMGNLNDVMELRLAIMATSPSRSDRS
jgi:hypothetical protein